MQEKKKHSAYSHNNLSHILSLSEEDIRDQDDDDEEPEDYFISDGKRIQKIRKHRKWEGEED